MCPRSVSLRHFFLLTHHTVPPLPLQQLRRFSTLNAEKIRARLSSSVALRKKVSIHAQKLADDDSSDSSSCSEEEEDLGPLRAQDEAIFGRMRMFAKAKGWDGEVVRVVKPQRNNHGNLCSNPIPQNRT